MPLDYSAADRYAQTAPAPTPPTEKKKGMGKGPYAALIAGNAADLASTVYALESGKGKEANPVLGQNPYVIAGAKVGATLTMAFLLKSLAKDHPKIAKALGYSVGGAMGALGARNIAVVTK
jgi:hypothetical protein